MPEYPSESHYTEHSDSNFIKFFDRAKEEKKVIFTPPLFTRSGVFYHVALIPVFKQDGVSLEGILSIAFFPTINPLGSTLSGLSLSAHNFFALTNELGMVIATTLEHKDILQSELQTYMKSRGVTPEKPYQYKRKSWMS